MAKTIKLNEKLVVKGKAAKSGKKYFRSYKRKKLLLILLFSFLVTSIILGALSIYFIVLPSQRVMASVERIGQNLEQIKQEFDSKDLTLLDVHIEEIQGELGKIDTEVDRYEFLKDLELTKGYYDNLQVVKRLSQKTRTLLSDVLPETKVILESLGYKVEIPPKGDVEAEPAEAETKGVKTSTSGPAEEGPSELKAVIGELPRLIKLYDDIEDQILDLIQTFNEIDPNYIPDIGTGGYKEKIVQAQALTLEFPAISARLKETFSVLPQLLGSDRPARYLLILQNEKEMRSSGGLLSAFGNLRVDKGEFGDEIRITDMWDLELYVSSKGGTKYRNIYGQLVLMLRGCGATALRAQDAGIYPDLSLTMEMFRDYYAIANKYNSSKYPEYDHVMIVNTFFASDLISLVEPLQVGDKVITSENVAREIFSETSTKYFNPVTRKSFIGEVATAAQEKLNKLSGSDLMKVVEVFIKTVQAKNIAFASRDPNVQAYFDEMGMTGRIEKNFSGDYFHLNEAQVCALKSNFYVRDQITQDIYISENGSVSKDVNVFWWNDHVFDKKTDGGIITDIGRFLYRGWIRVFMPQGSKVTKSDGLEKSRYVYYSPKSYFDDKMQKQISDNVIVFDQRRNRETDPVASYQLNVSYNLPESIKYSDDTPYRMLIQKHPGKKNEPYKITIHHEGQKTTIQFELDRDKVLTYKRGVVTIDNYDKRLDDYLELVTQLRGEETPEME